MPDQATVCVEAKPWWRSTVLWLNAAAVIVAMLTEVSTTVDLPPSIQRWLLIALAAGNGILRFRTVQPVTTSRTAVGAEAPAPPPPVKW